MLFVAGLCLTMLLAADRREGGVRALFWLWHIDQVEFADCGDG